MIDLTALKNFLDANAGKYKSNGEYLPAGQIANLLVSPVGIIDNPNIPQVTKPVTTASLLNAAPTTLASIGQSSDFLSQLDVIGSRIREGDNAGVANWAAVMLSLGKMNQTEYDAVVALSQEVMNDPNSPTTIPGPSDLFTNFNLTTIDNSTIDSAIGR